MAEPLSFTRRARRPAAFIMLASALIVLAFLIFGVEAHPAIVTVFAVLMSPALFEIIRNAESTLHLDDTHLEWQSGRQSRRIVLADIDRVTLQRIYDFSFRGWVHLKSGQRLRIPEDAMPDADTIRAALETRGIPVSRSIFSAN